jgi:hypothetical protein
MVATSRNLSQKCLAWIMTSHPTTAIVLLALAQASPLPYVASDRIAVIRAS